MHCTTLPEAILMRDFPHEQDRESLVLHALTNIYTPGSHMVDQGSTQTLLLELTPQHSVYCT